MKTHHTYQDYVSSGLPCIELYILQEMTKEDADIFKQPIRDKRYTLLEPRQNTIRCYLHVDPIPIEANLYGLVNPLVFRQGISNYLMFYFLNADSLDRLKWNCEVGGLQYIMATCQYSPHDSLVWCSPFVVTAHKIYTSQDLWSDWKRDWLIFDVLVSPTMTSELVKIQNRIRYRQINVKVLCLSYLVNDVCQMIALYEDGLIIE